MPGHSFFGPPPPTLPTDNFSSFEVFFTELEKTPEIRASRLEYPLNRNSFKKNFFASSNKQILLTSEKDSSRLVQ